MKKVPLFHRFKSADQTVIVISPAARVKSVTSSTPEGLKITLVSGRLGRPAAPHTPCAEQVQQYKQQQRQIAVMQQTKAVALSLSASLTNQSKSPRDWAAVCDVDYAPSACVCFLFSFFSFMICVMPQNCLIKSLREDQTKSSVDIFWRRVPRLVGSKIVALKKLDLALQRLALPLRCFLWKADYGLYKSCCSFFSLSSSLLRLLLLHCQNAVRCKYKDCSRHRCGNLPRL